MKILLVSGTYPPDSCGVGDYTYRLSQALQHEGLEIELLEHKQWRLRDARSLLDAVDNARADIIHIQYPTVGYRWALGPQFLSYRRRCVVTIHEVTQAHPLRKLSLYGFWCTARQLVFTSKFEQLAAAKLAPWILKKSDVIPIGSNIQMSLSAVGTAPNTIGYFGLIRPNKGLEQVIAFAKVALNKGNPFRILIIGSEVDGQQAYSRLLRQRSTGLPVEWRVGLQGTDLDAALAECKVAYLPFPDGASERRSSLLTFLSRGTPVITTTGPYASEELRSAVQFAATPEDAFGLAENLIADDCLWNDLHEKGTSYANMFSWEGIARKHIELYQNLYRI